MRNPDYHADASADGAMCTGDGGLQCVSDFEPSNGLAKFLDLAKDQLDIDLGGSATINSDTGDVTVAGARVAVSSDTAAQLHAPTIRVFIVRSLKATDVVVTGQNAFAIVSSGDITVNGVFSASAKANVPGPGAFNDGICKGKDPPAANGKAVGAPGGGGYGSRGGAGGSARAGSFFDSGGGGGKPTGEVTLVPLRGGCDSGDSVSFRAPGAGGGAMQFVSRSRIVVSSSGTIAANGDSGEAGGSGGGILLEAPAVDVSGHVVANGGAGPGQLPGEDGRLDGTPAQGGAESAGSEGAGGNGAAGAIEAMDGGPVDTDSESSYVYGGGGGGGVGRIRVNSAAGGQQTTGLYSPAPNPGALATR